MTGVNIFTGITILLITLFISWRFYFLRNPLRKIPSGDLILAPADGTVLYIKKIKEGEVPVALKKRNLIPLHEITGCSELTNQGGLLIGIFMSPLSVHRNRIPVAGKVVLQKYQEKPNNFSMVRATTDVLFKRKQFEDYEFITTNERLTTLIKGPKGIISVTQIADKWIRKIVSWVEVGQDVTAGEQFGMIRFGSQCDIFIPDSYELNVKIKIGEYIYAGQSVLGEFMFENSESHT